MNDSVSSAQFLLSTLIQAWSHTAIESQAYREVAVSEPLLKDKVATTLASPVFVERQRQADALRSRVLQAVKSGDSETVASCTGLLAALLGRTPENFQKDTL